MNCAFGDGEEGSAITDAAVIQVEVADSPSDTAEVDMCVDSTLEGGCETSD